ncbi:MAG: amino acid racemase, partial [Candidatus Bipolaricaulota bacterium]|nr:amino acid racemase [Candidatus Bipolaricaulota bacterium]
SAESTVSYYLALTREYTRRHGNLGYPEIITYSVNFQDFLDWQNTGRWDLTAERMIEVFEAIAQAGAELGLIATNTLHRVFDEVAARSPIPLINIVAATAQAIKKKGLSTVGLLGTRFTMTERFYLDGLAHFGITALTPQSADERAEVHRIIVEELVRGEINKGSRQTVVGISERLLDRGAEGVILGCTELPLLIEQNNLQVPVFDTARIHALAALDAAEGKSY